MSDNSKKIFLLDAFALIYRAHFAFIKNPRINSKGINTSAVFGFTNSLLEILNKEKPTHLGIVYDTAKPTFRHENFVEYKANRQEQPEDIAVAIPYIYRMADALCIPNLYLDGFEADDIIGTLAKKAESQGFQVYMMTPDKDFAQLVSDRILQYKPAYMGKPAEIYGVEEIKKKWEISDVSQVIDILGLMGDSIDNIPGVPGVGEKTAKKLIQEYGSVENLVANKDKITGKLGESIRVFADQALLSKQLATIHTGVPIEFDEKALEVCDPDYSLLSTILDELEFRAMKARFFPSTPETIVTKAKMEVQSDLFSFSTNVEIETQEKKFLTIADKQPQYKLITTEEERRELLTYLKKFKVVSFDTETTDVNPHDCRIVGFSFSVKPDEGFYVAANSTEEEDKIIFTYFREILEDESIVKVGQNIKYDLIISRNYGVDIKGPVFDTMLAHYLIEPDMRHNIDILSERYLNYKPISIEALIGKGKKQLNMSALEPELIRDYACEDADVALQLKNKLEPELDSVNAKTLFNEIEIPLVSVLADMERAGVLIDRDTLKAYSRELAIEITRLEGEIQELAGMNFNLNSPVQLGEILFERLKLDPKAKRTQKSKQYATGEDILTRLSAKHEIVQKILDYRSLQKLRSTYVDSLPLLINKQTGRVHTSYNQAVAATGRLSSTDPNLQNIPIRTEKGREIRRAFIPRDKDHLIMSADYSQIELRLIAELSGDENMIEAFRQKKDIHTATAAKIYGIDESDVNPEMRRKAKMVNFGIIYGISAFGLSQRLNIPRAEAAEIIDQYNRQYPKINQYMNRMIDFARQYGYVETIKGRRRYLRDINSGNATTRGFAERNAINAPIQGSAADMIKVAMINIYREFKRRRLKSKMILQVHDELVFDALKTELDEIAEILNDKMCNALLVNIPIEIEIGVGENWLEAH